MAGGGQVPSLAGELRSQMSCDVAKKKKRGAICLGELIAGTELTTYTMEKCKLVTASHYYHQDLNKALYSSK